MQSFGKADGSSNLLEVIVMRAWSSGVFFASGDNKCFRSLCEFESTSVRVVKRGL